MASSRRAMYIMLLVAVAVVAVFYGLNPARARLEDGTYTGESDRDERGQFGRVVLTVDQGKIKKVDYDEIMSDGTPKGPDYPYQKSVEAQPGYEEQLVEKQDPNKVEAISGATSTHEKFQQAAKRALDQAR